MNITPAQTPAKADLAIHVAFVALLCVLMLLEWVTASQSYYTVGAINSGVLHLAIGLNIIPVILYLFRKRIIAILLVLIIGITIVPETMRMSHGLFFLQEEAANAVTYAYETKVKTGQYPRDLSGYTFQNPDFKKDIEYRFDDSTKSFHLSYHVSGTNTMRWYDSESGWGYYDD